MKLLPLGLLLFTSMVAPKINAGSLFEVPLKDIDGQNTSLEAYRGKVMLIVNVASACGFTKQYTGLEAAYKKYQPQGLVVLGFPCNQFGHQESGSNEEIKTFCSSKFHVTFPMFDKIDVNGAQQHPLYAMLTGKDSPFPGKITWNFNKFLVGHDGKILQRFDSKVTPESPELIAAVETALAAK